MKTLRTALLLILATLLIPSCKNINKMVEEGRYDEAITHAVKNLAGEKKKKVEYVKALEKSFNRMNQSQLQDILHLSEDPERKDWNRIIWLSNDIIDRQTLVAPLLPLRASNGYRAKFEFVDAEKWKRRAIDGFLVESWKAYDALIPSAREGNKNAAREAFYILEEIEYYENSPELTSRIQEARQLGTNYILMRIVQHEDARLNTADIDYIRQMFRSEPVRDIWSEIHMLPRSDITYDYLSEVAIQDIIISPIANDRTLERVSREIQSGEKAMRDTNGKVVVDSTGEVVMVPIYETAYGEIVRIRQYKDASIQAEIRILQREGNQKLTAEKKTVTATFQHQFQDWRGDRRAFERKPVRGEPAPFPSDEQLLAEGVEMLERYSLKYTIDWMESWKS